MRRSDAEIGRLVRHVMGGRRIKRRRLYRPYEDRRVVGGGLYEESDDDFFDNNREVVIDLMEVLARKK